ncbi:MAG TPA: hypothetical protein VGE52_02675 [Pirellulales bacterium]
MNRHFLLIALLLALAGPSANAETPLDAANLAPEEGLLVLRNGQTLKGRIARAGDRWFVWLPDGEIRVAAKDVELFCRDLHEGYLRKRSAIAPQRLLDRLQLAEWCLSHQLLDEARQETAAAAAIDPEHPNVKYLQRRLELIVSPAEAPPAPIAPADVGPSGDELDRFAKKLSPETVALFSQTIQPLLVNRCGMGACHGPQSTNRWTLQRIPLSGSPRQRLTQRNLFATFPFVSGPEPSVASLYVKASTAHGGAKHPTFGPRDAAALQQLAIWLQYAGRDAVGLQPLLPFQVAPAASITPAAATENGASASAAAAGLTTAVTAPIVEELPSPTSAAKTPAAPDGAPFTPVDPFDPEIFNRQFGAAP